MLPLFAVIVLGTVCLEGSWRRRLDAADHRVAHAVQAAIDSEPNQAMRHVRRGEMLLRAEPSDFTGARAEFNAALAIDPSFTTARDWLARTAAMERAVGANQPPSPALQ
jgi:hypothetical protein